MLIPVVTTAQDADSAPATDSLASVSVEPITGAGQEKFVRSAIPLVCSGTLEMLKSAEIRGHQIRIRNVAQWSNADSVSLAPIADLVIDNFDTPGNRKLTIDEVRETLRGAGVNMGEIHFSGPTVCLLSHSELPEAPSPTDAHGIVKQWAEQKPQTAPSTVSSSAKQSDAADPVASAISGDVRAGSVDSGEGDDGASPVHTLHELLVTDLCQRLNLVPDQVQVRFEAKDRPLLRLTEPGIRFDIQPRRVRDLGHVSWDVVISTGDKQRVVEVNADARMWQREWVLEKPANYRQVLRDGDISQRRVLLDHIPDDAVLTRDQVVGQQAARDLKAGTVLTARLVDPVPLARNGQFITVTLNTGLVQITTVGKALESGSYGQTIKVESQDTHDVFDVTLTGPQEGSVGPATAPANGKQVANADR